MASDHEALPLPDYDHLPLATLMHRIRSLDIDSLRALISYEEAHAHRLPVLEVLNARLTDLKAGATPSGGHPGEVKPEQPPPPSAGSPVAPASAAPGSRPNPHGVAGQPAREADRWRDAH